jgi:ribonuclease Z
MCKALGLKALTTVEVSHRTQAYGVVIDHQDGWRIV